ncbi:MAG: amino acid adenylation domain-containing protein, partial [Candidatus Omnitrophica bacterium]|nr:amino acid adenylation domain-containing protein [Candidatus Omnitrophota bacterium]
MNKSFISNGARTLGSGFIRSAKNFPDRPALEVNREIISYRDLSIKAASLSATLTKHSLRDSPPLTAVFAYRSQTAFAGILASLFCGHGYVPLNRTFPTNRTKMMLERSSCRSMVVDSESAKQLNEVLEGINDKKLIIISDLEDVASFTKRWPNHIFLGACDLEPATSWKAIETSIESIAYILFTSGSTGLPKGVMITHRNVTNYIDIMLKRYDISENDRFSQIYDMTFDLSVFDMFIAWERGACICCLSDKERLKPDKFINKSNLTIWFSVPSTAIFMKRLGVLKPNQYPKLRFSLFCGEALPTEVTKAWAEAAPNSIVENLYGPTETTITIMSYKWDPKKSPQECYNGIVPIGCPNPGAKILVVDEDLKEVPFDSVGELLLNGPQVSPGYWQDVKNTKAAFVCPPGHKERYYRTGDHVKYLTKDGPMVFLGRMDSQIKIRGYRAELGEIETVLREESGVEAVIAIGWPVTAGGADGVVAFVGDNNVDVKSLLTRVAMRLPEYMVPRAIYPRENLPLNPNGKFDKKALSEILKE